MNYPERQRRYNYKYRKRNKGKQRIYIERSTTKRFILRDASKKDMRKIREWLSIRTVNDLKNN